MMGDIMYLNQALRQPDAKEFVTAVVREINGHVDNKNWELVPQDTVPEDAQIIPSVWLMRCKCDLTTNNVKSHKARLNLQGGKQVYGMNYFETYTPVVTWFAIRLVIIF
jgi:histone deacetylase 1/2